MTVTPKKLTETFAVLQPDLFVEPVKVTPTVYDDLDARFAAFRDHVLIASYDFGEDWATWEKHPAGDEVVVLLSGKAEFVLRLETGKETVVLEHPGSYLIVPKNIWHTAHVSEPTRMIFITPGEGTENKVDPDVAT